MPKYSEVHSDERILEMLHPSYKNILLLGCGGCMNESLAFKNSLPMYSYGADAADTAYPAIEAECTRLVSLLRQNCFTANKIILPSGSNARCIRDMGKAQFSLPDGIEPDVVLVLACPDGYYGLSRIIFDIPLIRISKWTGTIFYRYSDDGYKRIIERGKITPLPIEA